MGGYELGDDVSEEVRIRKPAGIVVSTRLERDLADKLLARAEQEGKRLSQVLREAVVHYVSGARPQSATVQPGFAQVTFGGPDKFQSIALVQSTVITQAPPEYATE